jgi:rSAM/selenodomain-associated transferase 1
VRPALLVLAKAPVPGQAKTRLCPPCTPEEAAALARAALADTVVAAEEARAGRRVLVLAGGPAPPLPPGWTVAAQRGEGLAERLAAAFADHAPALLVAMDTPHVDPGVLDTGLDGLATHDAVFGPARDGGFWAIGLRTPDDAVFAGVPMSVRATGAIQRARLAALGLRTAMLPSLRDVDTIADARAVAREAPDGRFAAALAATESARAAA